MNLFRIWLLCATLLLVACGGGRSETSETSETSEADQQATKVIAEITKMAAEAEANAEDDETPEQALNYYITACDAGDTVSARDVDMRLCLFEPHICPKSQDSC